MDQTQNPLGTRAIGPLIAKFAVPAIISGLVSALYNIVQCADQAADNGRYREFGNQRTDRPGSQWILCLVHRIPPC